MGLFESCCWLGCCLDKKSKKKNNMNKNKNKKYHDDMSKEFPCFVVHTRPCMTLYGQFSINFRSLKHNSPYLSWKQFVVFSFPFSQSNQQHRVRPRGCSFPRSLYSPQTTISLACWWWFKDVLLTDINRTLTKVEVVVICLRINYRLPLIVF